MTRTRRATASPGLIVAVVLIYTTVIGSFFAAGYLVGRLLL